MDGPDAGLWNTVAAAIARLEPPRIPDRTMRAELPAGGDALPALTAAIAACHAAGGGRVVVGRGLHPLHGPLLLRDRIELHLEDGCELRFSGEPADFLPPVVQRWEGTEVVSHAPLISARGASDIAITGSGVIDGQGHRAFALWQPLQKPDQERLRDQGRDGVPVAERVYGAGTRLRPSLFQPLGCRRVLLAGVTLRDSPFWCIHPTYCHEVTVRDVTVDSLNHNNDGCDPDSCADVLIEGCTFRTGDDAIAIKSGRDQDGWRVGRPTERVLVRGCQLSSRINGVCIGSEMSGGVRHIFVERCRLPEVSSALYLKGNRDRGGVIEDVFMRDLEVGTAAATLVRCEPNYHSHRGGVCPPAMRRIRIEDVRCSAAGTYGFYLDGDPALPLAQVVLRRIAIGAAANPGWLRHAREVHLEDVTLAGRTLSAAELQAPDGAAPLPLRM